MNTDRSDARRHRLTLLDAASRVFLEHGVTAPLEMVIEMSGLGRATLYRHFPDRASLVLALLDESLDRLEAFTARGDPGSPAFLDMIRYLCDVLVSNPALADFWRVDRRSPERIERADRFCAIFERSMLAGIADGTLRPDLRRNDILLMMAMLGTVVREPDADARRVMIERMVDLILSGIGQAKDCPER